MQLLNTNVAKTTEGTITVEFHGEGNELIAVRMASDVAADDSAAIARAKQMMVQTAAFGEASSSGAQGEGVSIDDTLTEETDSGTGVI